MKLAVTLLGLLLTTAATAQDSLTVLGFRDYMAIVEQGHPVLRQLRLTEQRGQRELQMSRGAFDPKLESAYDQKFFDDKNYWRQFGAELKIPTASPIDVKVGYERNDPDALFFDPESSVPADGLLYAGLELDVLQGLWRDEERLALRQGQLAAEMSIAEQQKLVNKFYVDVIKDYWNWYAAYTILELQDSAVDYGMDNYSFVRVQAVRGELAIIDTVEALLLLQDFQQQQLLAQIDLAESRYRLAANLWTPDGLPLVPGENLRPEPFRPLPELQAPLEDSLRNVVLTSHPALQSQRLKVQGNRLGRQWAQQALLPQLTLNYNFLNEPFTAGGETNPVTFDNNYKWGFQFSLPLFLRKDRAKLGLADIKLSESEFQLASMQLALPLAFDAATLAYRNAVTMRERQEQMAIGSERLYFAEETKFFNGESSLFLLNSRATKALSAYLKLAKMEATVYKSRAELWNAAGVSPMEAFEF